MSKLLRGGGGYRKLWTMSKVLHLFFFEAFPMLDSGMIPPGNSDIIHTFLLGKTWSGEEIRTKGGMATTNNAVR